MLARTALFSKVTYYSRITNTRMSDIKTDVPNPQPNQPAPSTPHSEDQSKTPGTEEHGNKDNSGHDNATNNTRPLLDGCCAVSGHKASRPAQL